MVLYPLLFKKKIITKDFAEKLDLDSAVNVADEFAEIFDYGDENSVVEYGDLAGKTLKELCKEFPSDLIGHKFSSPDNFPIEIKLINTLKKMPMTVHPDDTSCREMKKGKSKIKVWYILDHIKDAQVFVGLKQNVTKQMFLQQLNSQAIEDVIQTTFSRKGDAYFIPGGRINALSEGNWVLQIAQNSQSKYRFYNWGNEITDLELSKEEVNDAISSIHFTDRMQPRIVGDCSPIVRNKRHRLVSNCPFFLIEELRLFEAFFDDTRLLSFNVLFSTGADFEISCSAGNFHVQAKRVVLIPANIGNYKITPCDPTVIVKIKL